LDKHWGFHHASSESIKHQFLLKDDYTTRKLHPNNLSTMILVISVIDILSGDSLILEEYDATSLQSRRHIRSEDPVTQGFAGFARFTLG